MSERPVAPVLPGIDKDWKPPELVKWVLELKMRRLEKREYGPFKVILAREWLLYLDEPYYKQPMLQEGDDGNMVMSVSSRSIRERLLCIEGITEVVIDATAVAWTVSVSQVKEQR